MTVTQWVDKIYPRIKHYQTQNENDNCYADVIDGDDDDDDDDDDDSDVVVDNNLSSYNHFGRVSKRISCGVDDNRDKYHHQNCNYQPINNSNHSGNDEIEDMSLPVEHLHSLAHHLYECELNTNEILYFPSMWMHATLNIDDYNVFMSVFIDTQLIKR